MRNALMAPFLLVLLAACGGGGGGDGDSGPVSIPLTIGSDRIRDGDVADDGTVSVAALIRVGDDVSNREVRGFVSFPLNGIPAGSIVTEATLVVTRVSGPAGLPFPDVRVDRIQIGPTLTAGDFDISSIDPDFGALTNDGSGAFHLDVRTQVQDDVANARTHCDFRLRSPIPSDGDGTADMEFFASGEDATDGPVLVLRFQIP